MKNEEDISSCTIAPERSEVKHEHFRQFQYLVNHTYQAIPTQERVRQSRFVLFVYNNATTVYICLLYLQELDGCRVIRVI